MSAKSYISALDGVLQPAGFTRNGRDWIRIRDGFEDCVNLQVSSRAGTTANISSKDLATDAIWNEAVPPDSPGLYYHTTVRIGQLMDRTDHWWRRNPNGPKELSQAIVTYALPFLESRRSLENQAVSFGRGETKWFNARLRIGLAITLYRMGEHDEACAALANPPKRLPPSWLVQVEAVRRRLGCGN